MTKTQTTMTDAEAEALADKIEQMDPEELFKGGREMVSLPYAHFLAALAAQEHADELMQAAIAELREDGFAWEGIGQLLGITGEGARKRYAAKVAGGEAKRVGDAFEAKLKTSARSAGSGRVVQGRSRPRKAKAAKR